MTLTGEIVISYTSNDDELMEDLKKCHDFYYHNWASILNELVSTYARVKNDNDFYLVVVVIMIITSRGEWKDYR